MTRPTPDAAAPDALAAVMVRVTIDGGEMLYLIAQPCPQADGATRWSVEGCGSHTTPRGAALMACVSRKLAAVEVYVPGQHSPAAGAHAAEVERLTDALARLRAPAADLAAIGARAAAYTAAREHVARVLAAPSTPVARLRAAQECDLAAEASAADVLTLLALLAAEREGRAAEVAGARAAECERWARHCDAIEASARARITHEDDDTDLRAEVTADTACSMARELRATLATKGAPDV